MTVASETNRSGPYPGNGVAKIFDYDFRIVDRAHLSVIKTDANQVETTLTVDVDYSVSGVGGDDGSIETTVAPATGTSITILRNVPFTQETDLENQGAYYAETVEDALDLAAMRDQELKEKLDRALVVSVGNSSLKPMPPPDPGKPLVWSDDGLGLENGEETYNGVRSRIDQEVRERINGENALRSLFASSHAVSTAYFDTVSGAAIAKIPSDFQSVIVGGKSAAGDAPLQFYKSVGAEPDHPGKFRSDDGSWWELTGPVVNAAIFGLVAGGLVDNSLAIQNALTFWKYVPCTLLFPDPNARYRMASPVSIDLGGIANVGDLIFRGAISPDPGIGAAITISNVRGGNYTLEVNGGGQTADYSQADPVGGDEAFRFVNCLGGVIDRVGGQNYKGRVLRLTSGAAGPDGFKTQSMLIRNCYFASSSPVSDDEATRLAHGVGQGFYIDTYAPAFGTIDRIWAFWELYGSVIERTTDLTLNDIETLYRGNTGFKLKGCISFWGRNIKLGSELAGWTGTLLSIEDSTDGSTNTQNSAIDNLFLVGGAIGLSVTNAGVAGGQSLDIKQINSRLNTNTGVLLNNCRKVSIGNLTSYGDQVGLHVAGASNDLNIKTRIRSSKAQAIIVDAEATGNIVCTGSAFDGNTVAAAGVSLIDVNTASPVYFSDFVASSANVDYLYDLVSGNATRIIDGSVTVAGSTAIINNAPNRARNVRGWTTANQGAATIPAGGTSVVVTHGIVKAPDNITVSPRGPDGVDFYVSSVTATTFTINVKVATTAAVSMNWMARADYAGA